MNPLTDTTPLDSTSAVETPLRSTQISERERFRELLFMLTWRDIKVRYKQSVMGFLWAVFMPALIVVSGVLVRTAAARVAGVPVTAADIGSVMVKAVPWAFFIGAVKFGTQSLVGNSNLVSKIAFPKEVFPLAAVGSSLFDFAIASVTLVVVLLLFGWHPTLRALWSIPLFAVLVMFASALALFLSAANLFYRDVKYVVDAVLTFAIFFTPVLYDSSMLGRWQNVALLNPVAPLLEGISVSMIHGEPPQTGWVTYSLVLSMLLLFSTYVFFKRVERQFAERL